MSYAASVINSALTMKRVIEFYGIGEFHRGNFIKCPFHFEKTASLSVKRHFFKCFGCGASGDIVAFVKMYFSLKYPEAIKKLDRDFGLHLGFAEKQTLKEHKRAMEARRKHELEQKRHEEARMRAETEYWDAFCIWKRYDDAIIRLKPRQDNAEFDPLYVEAITHVAQASYNLDCAHYKRQVIECAADR